MSVSESFVTFLKDQANGVAQLCGGRIGQAPAHELMQVPYIVFMRNGRNREISLSGDTSEREPDHTYLDIECRGNDQHEAEVISDTLRDLLDGYRGTWGSLRIQGVFCTDQSDDYVQIPAGSNKYNASIETQVEIRS